jgi:hypothetical protein
MLRRALAPVLVAAFLFVTIGTHAEAGERHHHHPNLHDLRHATAKFHSVKVAEKAGYGRLLDKDGIACIDMPPLGAMGIHYVNGPLVQDGKINARTPEAVLYEPGRYGRLRLVGVEYIVDKAVWDAKHRHKPRLFGEDFDTTGAGNRFDLAPFYSLHVWVWKHNPAGTFTMWNPRVHCPGSSHRMTHAGAH